MITQSNLIQANQAEVTLPPDLLYIILGPTASGKTKLAVQLAQLLQGEIISVDSRQVYKGMDIGTGKDIQEYQDIPYHLIDICAPGEKYNVSRFQLDFEAAYTDVLAREKRIIACGGTGMYLHALLQQQPYIDVPTNIVLRETLIQLPKDELLERLKQLPMPIDFLVDSSSHKRLIRAIEILTFLQKEPNFLDGIKKKPVYPHLVFGLDPTLEKRRANIFKRLHARLEEGLLEEIKLLLKEGLSHDDLQYYGLEYKYGSLYLDGVIDRDLFLQKLETEIHRYAKRQMTFFRKMEKDGIKIHWLKGETTEEQLNEIIQQLKKG